jgi:hypothetical protein
MTPPRIRRCTECKRTFITPDSFRQHKRKDGVCRSEEALRLVGYVETAKGWKQVCMEKMPK